MSDPFVKLYSTILESSLWWGEDTPTRLVWITLLVASDHDGVYSGTLPGLAGKARVTLEEARQAVWRLQQPDKESRTPDNDGRRIDVIPGTGYRLLNYEKYRDKRSQKQVMDAVYKARQRERSKSDMSNRSGKVSIISDLESDLRSDPDPEAVTVVDPKRGRFAPADFEPDDGHRVRCQELKLDVAAELRDFKLHEFNRAYSDWPRRFGKWIEESRIRRETERAKAAARPTGARGGPVLVLEATDKHRGFAAKHGLNLEAVMRSIAEEQLVDKLGLGRAREIIGERLSREAKRKAEAANVRPTG